jgi:phenylpropionate dioxygenase-like ring-hydroxylating dioxygenase large terminal subunit
MNWKLVVDGVQDVYHLAFLHPKTVGPFFHTNVFILDQHERAWRLVVARRSVTDIRDADPDDFDIERHAIGNYTIYPGTILVTEPGHFDVWSIAPDPDDHRAAIITLRMLVRERARDDKQARLYDKSWGLLLETLLNEDWFVSKTIGTNVAHGHVPELVYGRNEHPAQVFHRMISEDAEALR